MTCPSELRFWCSPNNAGVQGVTLQELADLLTPLLPVTSGKVAQVVGNRTGNVIAVNGVIPFDDTIPQQTEGDEVLTVTITPTNALSTLIVSTSFYASSSGSILCIQALFRDSTADAIGVSEGQLKTQSLNMAMTVNDIPANSTNPTTFKLRVGPQSAAIFWINGFNNIRTYGGQAVLGITVWEILP